MQNTSETFTIITVFLTLTTVGRSFNNSTDSDGRRLLQNVSSSVPSSATVHGPVELARIDADHIRNRNEEEKRQKILILTALINHSNMKPILLASHGQDVSLISSTTRFGGATDDLTLPPSPPSILPSLRPVSSTILPKITKNSNSETIIDVIGERWRKDNKCIEFRVPNLSMVKRVTFIELQVMVKSHNQYHHKRRKMEKILNEKVKIRVFAPHTFPPQQVTTTTPAFSHIGTFRNIKRMDISETSSDETGASPSRQGSKVKATDSSSGHEKGEYGMISEINISPNKSKWAFIPISSWFLENIIDQNITRFFLKIDCDQCKGIGKEKGSRHGGRDLNRSHDDNDDGREGEGVNDEGLKSKEGEKSTRRRVKRLKKVQLNNDKTQQQQQKQQQKQQRRHATSVKRNVRHSNPEQKERNRQRRNKQQLNKQQLNKQQLNKQQLKQQRRQQQQQQQQHSRSDKKNYLPHLLIHTKND